MMVLDWLFTAFTVVVGVWITILNRRTMKLQNEVEILTAIALRRPNSP